MSSKHFLRMSVIQCGSARLVAAIIVLMSASLAAAQTAVSPSPECQVARRLGAADLRNIIGVLPDSRVETLIRQCKVEISDTERETLGREFARKQRVLAAIDANRLIGKLILRATPLPPQPLTVTSPPLEMALAATPPLGQFVDQLLPDARRVAERLAERLALEELALKAAADREAAKKTEPQMSSSPSPSTQGGTTGSGAVAQVGRQQPVQPTGVAPAKQGGGAARRVLLVVSLLAAGGLGGMAAKEDAALRSDVATLSSIANGPRVPGIAGQFESALKSAQAHEKKRNSYRTGAIASGALAGIAILTGLFGGPDAQSSVTGGKGGLTFESKNGVRLGYVRRW